MQNNNQVFHDILEDMKAGWRAFNAAVDQTQLDNDCYGTLVTNETMSQWTEAVTRCHNLIAEAKRNYGHGVAQALFHEYEGFWDANLDHMDQTSLCEIEHRRLARALAQRATKNPCEGLAIWMVFLHFLGKSAQKHNSFLRFN